MTVRATRLLLAAAAVAALAIPGTAASTPSITADALRALQLTSRGSFVLIDVRSAADYAAGHLQGAVNIPQADLASYQGPPAEPVVVYCPGSCPMGEQSAAFLLSRGYQDVRYLDGGFAAWKGKAFPIEAAAPAPAALRLASLSAKDAEAKMKDGGLVVVDVRPSVEFKAGHLPGALSEPLETLTPSAVPDGEVLVYDRLSNRSRRAAEAFAKAGRGVVVLAGGMAGWARMRYPVEVK